jgi:hypothetical protein
MATSINYLMLCDLCAADINDQDYPTKKEAVENARAAGYKRKRVDGRMVDVCRACLAKAAEGRPS